MEDDQLLRYSRQIMMPEIDAAGQQRLLDSHITIIGMGGLGAPAAMYLAAAGVGQITIVDYDKVDLTNLQRQIIHGTTDIGREKTASAEEYLRELNPEVTIHTINKRLDEPELGRVMAGMNAVLDCTDNFDTRFMINRAAAANGIPLISAAVVRMEGQVTVFDPAHGSACYRCLYDEAGGVPETCSENGILAPVAGLVGSIQATETIKELLGIGKTLSGRLLMIDAKNMEFREIRIRKDPACPVCGVQANVI
jgi:molybdopterin/thiamine biosynthesis adenylyltransferase